MKAPAYPRVVRRAATMTGEVKSHRQRRRFRRAARALYVRYAKSPVMARIQARLRDAQ